MKCFAEEGDEMLCRVEMSMGGDAGKRDELEGGCCKDSRRPWKVNCYVVEDE